MVFRYLSNRSFLRICSVGILASFLTLTLFAQNPPRQTPKKKKMTIAVLDFEGRGVKPEEAASLSDVFQGVMVESQQFTVVDRNRIKAILEEQGFQQSEACSQVECIVQVGKILKVEKMFAGSIGKVGKRFTINIQVIDVQTAQILSSKPRQHEGAIEDLAEDVIPEIAREMIEELTGKRVSTVVTTTGGGSSWLWYVGGAVVVGGGVAAALLLSHSNPEKPKALPTAPVFPN